MKLSRLSLVAGLAVALVAVGCKKDSPTEPERTRSVVATVQIPATPTAPVTVKTDDPESKVEVGLDVAALQAIAQTAGGAATVKMTDVAPGDYSTLPPDEAAWISARDDAIMNVLAFDITTSAAQSAALQPAWGHALAATAAGTVSFRVIAPTGRRCPAGVIDLYQIIGRNATRLSSTVTIDNGNPQTISGSSSAVVFTVKHFVFAFGCPRIASGANG